MVSHQSQVPFQKACDTFYMCMVTNDEHSVSKEYGAINMAENAHAKKVLTFGFLSCDN